MADWTLLLSRSPLNTVTGTGVITPLTLVSGVSMSYALDDIDTISFSVPGRHYQAGLILEGETDVLAVRDDVVVQRFRVVSKTFGSSSGTVTCNVTASSYREIVNGWIFADGDTRTWDDPTEQTEVAWEIISEGQAKPQGNLGLGLTRGVMPGVEIDVVLEPLDVDLETKKVEYFDDGSARGAAIQALADGVQTEEGVSPGFEWTIEPDPSDPMTKMKFNAWNKGGRHYASGVPADFLLSEANMATWTVASDMSNYFNVGRIAVAVGSDTNNEATGVGVVTGFEPPVWIPADKEPELEADERRGRWEKNIPNDKYSTPEQIEAYGENVYAEAHERFDEWSCTLQPGRWEGRGDFWVGDTLRVVLQVPAVDEDGNETGDLNLDIDKEMRVYKIDITIGTGGAEQISLALNRPQVDILDQLLGLGRRLDDAIPS